MTERRRTILTQTEPGPAPEEGEPLGRASRLARQFAAAAKAPNTLRAYSAGWHQFLRWCRTCGETPFPPDPALVGLYLADATQRLTLPSLKLHLAALGFFYRRAGLSLDRSDPKIADVLAGIARTRPHTPRRKTALLPTELKAATARLPVTARGVRDRALLLVGWAGALRRSELVGLDLADTRITAAGLHLTLRQSKTDPGGEGQEVIVIRTPTLCAVTALEAWIEWRGDATGPLFLAVRKHGAVVHRRLSDKSVVRAVKAAVSAIGLDPKSFAGHSLRSGLVTTAHAHGASLPTIARQTRHRSIARLIDYVHSLDLWRDNVTSLLADPPP